MLPDGSLRPAPLSAEPLILGVRDIGLAAMLADAGQLKPPFRTPALAPALHRTIDRAPVLVDGNRPAALPARRAVTLGVQPRRLL